MDEWRRTRLPLLLDALTRSETDAPARRLIEAVGSEPVEVRERLIDEPAVRSRRLLFASGAEIILHDDAIVAVVIDLSPTPIAPSGRRLSEWLTGVADDASRDDLAAVLGVRPRFVGMRTLSFALGGGYVRVEPAPSVAGEARRYRGIVATVEQPGRVCNPEDDDCPDCSGLLVRAADTGALDVAATTAALTEALAAGRLSEDAHWVRLADLGPLHASGLMEQVESQLTCQTCRRVICFTLYRAGAPTFLHRALDEARRRPLGVIPPVEQWGDADRIATEADAMHYIDHEPGAWFAVEEQGVLYLDARYSAGAAVDGSALIRLDEAELAAYRAGGHAALDELARRVNDSAPFRDTSAFYERDLYRGSEGRRYRDAVSAAVVNHTWIAEQRR